MANKKMKTNEKKGRGNNNNFNFMFELLKGGFI